jgi:hypothetical protein
LELGSGRDGYVEFVMVVGCVERVRVSRLEVRVEVRR